MDYQDLTLASAIISAGIAIYLLYLKSFIADKAKNAASIQDIGKITRIVEETKKDFTKDIELLRSNLDLFGQNFNSIKSLERNALVDMANKYSAWLHSLVNFNLAAYSYDFYEPLIQQPLLFDQKHLEFNIAEDNLHLYIHDMEIIHKTTELKHATYKLQESVLISLSAFITNCKLYNQKKEMAEKLGLNKLEEIHKEYHEKQQPVIQRSLQERNEIMKTIFSPHIDFIKILNYRIYQLIQQKE